MAGVQEYLVSSSGQMSLPASARHRRHLDGGGPVDVIDLGFGVLTVPKGEGHRLLGDLVTRETGMALIRPPDSSGGLARQSGPPRLRLGMAIHCSGIRGANVLS